MAVRAQINRLKTRVPLLFAWMFVIGLLAQAGTIPSEAGWSRPRSYRSRGDENVAARRAEGLRRRDIEMLLPLCALLLIVAVVCLATWREIRRFLNAGGRSSPYGGVLPVADSACTAAYRPRLALRCRKCGSLDISRIKEITGIVAAIMKYRGLKPFKCRNCGFVFYHYAGRISDPPKVPTISS